MTKTIVQSGIKITVGTKKVETINSQVLAEGNEQTSEQQTKENYQVENDKRKDQDLPD